MAPGARSVVALAAALAASLAPAARARADQPTPHPAPTPPAPTPSAPAATAASPRPIVCPPGTLCIGPLEKAVEIAQPGPIPIGTEPLLTVEKGPFSAALGGYLRVGNEADAFLYTRGTVLPAIDLGYDIEAHLPTQRGRQLLLRTAAVRMQVASTPRFGTFRIGVIPATFDLDRERLPVDRFLLAPSEVERLSVAPSLVGWDFRLDRRGAPLSILLELADANGGGPAPADAGPVEGTTRFRFIRLEWMPWGAVDGVRSLRLGGALVAMQQSSGAERRLGLGYAHFRWRRLLVEGEVLRMRGTADARWIAWHALGGFDLIADFLQLRLAYGESHGSGIDAAPSAPLDESRAFVVAGLRISFFRRRMAMSLQWRGEAPARRSLVHKQSTTLFIDLRF